MMDYSVAVRGGRPRPRLWTWTCRQVKAADGGARATRINLLELRRQAIMSSPRILVSGASGPIGSALLPSLKARDSPSPSGAELQRWPRSNRLGPVAPLSPEMVSGFDAVIHLSGESIVGRWTEAKKRRIIESRAQGTGHLAEALAKAAQRPRVFISASAVGYYGNRGDEILREEVPPAMASPPKSAVSGKAQLSPQQRPEFARHKCALAS